MLSCFFTVWLLTLVVADDSASHSYFGTLVKRISDFELKTAKDLRTIAQADSSLDFLQKFVEGIPANGRNDRAVARNTPLLENAIDTFKLLQRWAVEYPDVAKKLHRAGYNVRGPGVPGVNNIDELYASAARHVAELLYHHSENVTEVLDGKIAGVPSKTGARLTENDLFEIASLLVNMKRYNFAVNIFQKLSERNVPPRLFEDYVEDIATAVIELLIRDFLEKDATAQAIKTETDYSKLLEYAKNLSEDSPLSEFGKLCRRKMESTSSTVKCDYYFPKDNYYRIGPVKREIHFHDPQVVQFYDVIHENEIKLAIAESLSLMETSMISSGLDTSYRDSGTAWLENADLAPVLQRVGRIAGLDSGPPRDTSYMEGLQLSHYLPGGQYKPHMDTHIQPSRDGARIATFMFYLNDVEKGGATAFVNLNITIQPVKGSAILWYNLLSDMTDDDRTRHAGCPVISGQKYVINVWTLSHNQMFLKPCLPIPKNATTAPSIRA